MEAADNVNKNRPEPPLAMTKRSNTHCPICPRENRIHTARYCIPYFAITSSPPDCQAKYRFTSSRHNTAITTHEQKAIKIAASAALRTSSVSFFPRALEITAFNPYCLPHSRKPLKMFSTAINKKFLKPILFHSYRSTCSLLSNVNRKQTHSKYLY